MIAQDVGSAIRGVERGDIFWGSGDDAGASAGATLAPAHFIVFLPNAAPGV
jgi:membrane-bound lytic murein transglycosylase A